MGRLLCRTRNSGVVLPWIYTRWNLTPINFLVRHIAVHLMRSAAIRSVNCAGMPTGLTTSSAAPLSDSLRMRQAIVRPLNSMLPVFMKRPLSSDCPLIS